jgi:hypothetical protein
MWERFLVERELPNLLSKTGNSLAKKQIINEVITLLINTIIAPLPPYISTLLSPLNPSLPR